MLVTFSRKMHIDMSMSKIYININSFLPAINLAAYFRVIGIGQFQKARWEQTSQVVDIYLACILKRMSRTFPHDDF